MAFMHLLGLADLRATQWITGDYHSGDSYWVVHRTPTKCGIPERSNIEFKDQQRDNRPLPFPNSNRQTNIMVHNTG